MVDNKRKHKYINSRNKSSSSSKGKESEAKEIFYWFIEIPQKKDRRGAKASMSIPAFTPALHIADRNVRMRALSRSIHFHAQIRAADSPS